MIFHAVKIVANELNNFLNAISSNADDNVVLSNIAFHEAEREKNVKDKVAVSIAKIQEERTLKNKENRRRNPVTGMLGYHNPKVVINVFLLFSFNSWTYEHALVYLSRTIKFFQSKNIYTHLNTKPLDEIPEDEQLESFKFILDLYSPSFEEINHLWSIHGGKQIPFVMYKMRLLELEYQQVQEERGLIKEIWIDSKDVNLV